MRKLVLLRHGESVWNLENRFTGWTDVDLNGDRRGAGDAAGPAAARGRLRVRRGVHLGARSVPFVPCGSVQEELDRMWIPVEQSWRLNERHYGALQGLNKAETAAKFGDAQVKIWRRAYATPPPALEDDDRGSRPRSALRGTGAGRVSPDRVPEGHGGSLPALLARADRTRRARRQAGGHRRARQQPARAGQVSGRRVRRGDRRAEIPTGNRWSTSWTKHCGRSAITIWAMPRRSRPRCRRSPIRARPGPTDDGARRRVKASASGGCRCGGRA